MRKNSLLRKAVDDEESGIQKMANDGKGKRKTVDDEESGVQKMVEIYESDEDDL